MEKKVIIYTQPTCPPCFQSKTWMTGADIPYEERDIRVNPDYVDELIKLGANATPTFVIGEEIIYGFNQAKIQEAWTAYSAS
jgi:glutaredoxin